MLLLQAGVLVRKPTSSAGRVKPRSSSHRTTSVAPHLQIVENFMWIFDFNDQGWGSNKARRTDVFAVKFFSTCC
jgi:hypothetical protein